MGVGLDVLVGAEQIGLGNVDPPDLASPWVELAEDLPVENAQVLKIIRARQQPDCEICDSHYR